jgi:HSP20 family protein
LSFVRWDPLQDLVSWHDRLRRSTGAVSGWTPPVDVYETVDRYVIVVELSGLGPDDFDVQATEEQVTVSGHRSGQSGDGRFIHVERGHGAFSRTFSFPHRLLVREISADFRDGLLTVTVPKQPAADPHRIDVAV